MLLWQAAAGSLKHAGHDRRRLRRRAGAVPGPARRPAASTSTAWSPASTSRSSSNTKNKDAALKFVKFMTSDARADSPEQDLRLAARRCTDAYSDPAFQSHGRQDLPADPGHHAPPRCPQVPEESQFETLVGTAMKQHVRRRRQRQADHRGVGEGQADRRAAADCADPGVTGGRGRGAEPGHGHRLREDPDGNQHHRAGRRPARTPRRGTARTRHAGAAAPRRRSCRTCCSHRPSCWNCSSTSSRCSSASGSASCELTQFHIRNWSAAPVRRAGELPARARLQQRRPARRCCTRSGSRWRSPCSSVGVRLAARHRRPRCSLQRPVPRPRRCCARCSWSPYALPVYAAVITWSFMLQRDTGLVNHVLVDQLHLVGAAAVLADRRQQLLVPAWSCRSGAPGRSRSCA